MPAAAAVESVPAEESDAAGGSVDTAVASVDAAGASSWEVLDIVVTVATRSEVTRGGPGCYERRVVTRGGSARRTCHDHVVVPAGAASVDAPWPRSCPRERQYRVRGSGGRVRGCGGLYRIHGPCVHGSCVHGGRGIRVHGCRARGCGGRARWIRR